MNYHYIEYMIKEQQKEEIEACRRMCLLKGAGYSDPGLVERAWSAFAEKMRLLGHKLKIRAGRCSNCLLQRKLVTQVKGNSL